MRGMSGERSLSRKRLSVGTVLLLIGVGCTNANVPLNPVNAPMPARTVNATRAALVHTGNGAPARAGVADDGWFVGLAISGGGSRSANFSAAVMFELQRLGLLDRVDAISSVSGGSLTAAYYCAADDAAWNPGNLQRLLTHSFAHDMWVDFWLPWNGVAMAVSDYDRTDLLAKTLAKNLYERNGRGGTYADLRSDRPRLYVNATDLQSGRKFVFSNESFDEINSDLAKYPLAYAVAASASVPVLLHQVTLRDYSTVYKQYRHLVDGGVVDNLGVQTLLETYQANTDRAKATGAANPYAKGGVLIVVDADTQFSARLSERGDTTLLETLGIGAQMSTTKLIQRASTANLADVIVQYAPADATAGYLRDALAQLRSTGYLKTKDREGKPLTIFHVALARAQQLKEAPFAAFAYSLDSIETYFDISEANAATLYQAARLIVKEQFEEKLVGVRGEMEGK